MAYVPYKKGTLLVPSGSYNKPDSKHLFAIITDACKSNRHLLVSFSRAVEERVCDPACQVAAGEHEFITQDSFIEYRLARIEHINDLTKRVDGWVYLPKDDITDALLVKIQEGVEKSKFIPKRIRNYFRDARR